jgi:hypothetical protein
MSLQALIVLPALLSGVLLAGINELVLDKPSRRQDVHVFIELIEVLALLL